MSQRLRITQEFTSILPTDDGRRQNPSYSPARFQSFARSKPSFLAGWNTSPSRFGERAFSFCSSQLAGGADIAPVSLKCTRINSIAGLLNGLGL